MQKKLKATLPSLEAQGGFSGIAARGAFWNVGMAGANKVVTLIGQVALAWLLSPADMGLAGMALAIASFTAFLSAGWVGDVLVQRGRYEKEAGQGFWLSLGLYSVLALCVVFSAITANLFGKKELSGLLLLIAVPSICSFLSPILGGRLKNQLDFKHLAIANFLEGFSYTCFSLILAKMGFGPYSLILSMIPKALAGSLYIIWLEGWPSITKPDFPTIKMLLNPTLSLSLTGFFTGLQMQAPIFCVGLVLDSSSTGHFAWGWAVAAQAVFLLSTNLRHVLMPVFTKMSSDPVRPARAALKAARIMTAGLTLVCGLQAFLAEPILIHFFPTKWHAAVPVVTWISLGLGFQGILISSSAWLNAVGKYRLLLAANFIPSFLAACFSLAGAEWGGTTGAAIGASVGIALGGLCPLVFFPIKIIEGQFRPLLYPLAASGLSWWLICFLFSNPSLLSRCQAATFFIIANILFWWVWDDGLIRGYLKDRFWAKKWN